MGAEEIQGTCQMDVRLTVPLSLTYSVSWMDLYSYLTGLYLCCYYLTLQNDDKIRVSYLTLIYSSNFLCERSFFLIGQTLRKYWVRIADRCSVWGAMTGGKDQIFCASLIQLKKYFLTQSTLHLDLGTTHSWSATYFSFSSYQQTDKGKRRRKTE